MSKKHPVIAVTGSSGAGTTTVKQAFERLFFRLNINPAVVEGDSFHRYDREEMRALIAKAQAEGRHFSHFSIEANLLKELEYLFRQYSETGTGKRRYYIHNEEEGQRLGGYKPGTFTPWIDIPEGTDLLFYEGLHGAVKNEFVDIPRYADLLVGVVPIVNLEWIQKIHRDTAERGYKPEDVTDTILRRMYDYVKVITPQFSQTDINFQRVPLVDTSNPFIARDIPSPDESLVIIRFKNPRKFNVDFQNLLAMIKDSFMSRYNSIVVPGGKMGLAMEIIFRPILERMMEEKKSA
ncbi:phosphoribulokinase [Methylocaldum szegediense]|uniref:phosphoribulokinase n=1 Tax=Methylocaldum szegediense TaxID=73780 RepID=A0ABM9I7E1_9GAMM|nr:phosphoribulokinase [Methylocaldum szegediense]CAI8940326.1 putative phosphoribulokinase [Methylocaldum szegediense]